MHLLIATFVKYRHKILKSCYYCTVAELFGVHSIIFKIGNSYRIRILKITAMHTTHTCMYGLYA